MTLRFVEAAWMFSEMAMPMMFLYHKDGILKYLYYSKQS